MTSSEELEVAKSLQLEKENWCIQGREQFEVVTERLDTTDGQEFYLSFLFLLSLPSCFFHFQVVSAYPSIFTHIAH